MVVTGHESGLFCYIHVLGLLTEHLGTGLVVACSITSGFTLTAREHLCITIVYSHCYYNTFETLYILVNEKETIVKTYELTNVC